MEPHTVPLDHDRRVIAHYETVTEDFYLADHHHEHIHFGYWPSHQVDGACTEIDREHDHPQSLIRMIKFITDPLNIRPDHHVVDASCGVGGTSRFLAREYGCNVLALDCAPSQIERATRLTATGAPEFESRIEYRVADVTKPWGFLPMAESVDAIVNIEAAVYYKRRAAFLAEAANALRPGGRLALQDWMRIDPMTVADYIEHITPICQHWHGWSLESLQSYSTLLERSGLVVEEEEDLAAHVLPNAHMLNRQAERYEQAGKAEYATWCQVLADAWLAGKFTLGRILATKAHVCAGRPSPNKPRKRASETPNGETEPAPSHDAPETPAAVAKSHVMLPELCWSVRREGRTIAESDPEDTDLTRTLAALQRVEAAPGDTYVVSTLEWSEPLPREEWTNLLASEARGTIGVSFTTEHSSEVITPERTIAWNETLPTALHRFLEKGLGGRFLEIRTAKSKTKLVRTGEPTLEAELYRGSSLVPLEPAKGENRAITIATGIAMWFANNVDAAGRLPYLWNTSEENPDHSSDNAIRRFLGSIALGRFAMHQGDETLNDAYRRNLTHLLDTYLQPLGDGMAIIAEKHAGNLGASSLAGLAILAGPEEDQDRQALSMLLRAVSSMTHERRGFRTHFYPADRNEQGWEFYSGEALLFLCEAARLKIPGASTEDELFVLYRRCRDRWRERRHVAFVSWHSQALASLYR